MAKIENNIGWCDQTGNKVTGCSKVSPGCKNCYAERGTRARVLRDAGHETWGESGERIAVADFSAKLRRLNKLCICDKCHEAYRIAGNVFVAGRQSCSACGGNTRRIRLFADSNSDFLDRKWEHPVREEMMDEIAAAENVDALLLTKRIQDFNELVSVVPKNVWLGVSVEDNNARTRIGNLKAIPASVKFISFEPLLMDLPMLDLAGIDWAIVGGESGKDRRDCGVDAIVSVALQCVAQNVPVYVKQASAFKSGQQGRITDEIWRLKSFPKIPVDSRE